MKNIIKVLVLASVLLSSVCSVGQSIGDPEDYMPNNGDFRYTRSVLITKQDRLTRVFEKEALNINTYEPCGLHVRFEPSDTGLFRVVVTSDNDEDIHIELGVDATRFSHSIYTERINGYKKAIYNVQNLGRGAYSVDIRAKSPGESLYFCFSVYDENEPEWKRVCKEFPRRVYSTPYNKNKRR